MSKKYKLIDCGGKRKLEVFGDIILIRPCPQALWEPKLTEEWENIDAEYIRTSEEKGKWVWNSNKYFYPTKKKGEKKFTEAGDNPKNPIVPQNWEIEGPNGLKWIVEPNEFGNIGVFVEHWTYVNKVLDNLKQKSRILNLFTYSGSNCVYLAKHGHQVTAVDSSKNAMTVYNNNLVLNEVPKEGQRLILEDCIKFINREIRRSAKYNCIMIDAPSYGRGTKGEVFKIEDDLKELLENAKELVEKDGYIVCTLHSPRFTPKILEILARSIFENATDVKCQEILVKCESGFEIPSGFLLEIVI